MKKTSYLSIDLDYWWNETGACYKYIKKVLNLGVPVHCFIEHNHMLRRINSPENKGLSKLYNIDFHDDFIPVTSYEILHGLFITNANWVEHVSWKANGEYIWCSPDKKATVKMGDGVCGEYKGPSSIKHYGESSGWKKAKIFDRAKRVQRESVAEVGICLSPDYSFPKSTHSAVKLLLENVHMNHFVKAKYNQWLKTE